MLNIAEIIQQIKKIAREKNFKACGDIKKLLLKNCDFIAQEYDPFIGELKSLYLKQSNFIVFREETTHCKNNRLHNAFKVKVIGPYHEQIFYLNILGPVIA